VLASSLANMAVHVILGIGLRASPALVSFCSFLFKFLSIPDDEQEKLKILGAEKLAYVLHNSRRLSQTRFTILMTHFVGMEYLPAINTEDILLDTLPPKFSKHNKVITIKFNNGFAFILTDPFNAELLYILNKMKPEKLFIASHDTIATVHKTDIKKERELDDLVSNINVLFPADLTQSQSLSLEVNLNVSPLILFVNKLLERAYILDASDIHIEPLEERVVVRYRIDGELVVIKQIRPRHLINVISSRIKIMGQMNIVERRLPQDGRFAYKDYGSEPYDFDVRVSVVPMNYGEKIVMRILDKKKSLLTLDKLGFSYKVIGAYRKQLKAPYGMILHVGPTGSGKSMSLYSALNEVNQTNINIQTAEDPIEYTMDGISQMQVNPSIGLTFDNALRYFLRQDPDILLVGEIRDRETSIMAVEAALTGHLIFSTLHSNDAPSTIVRLIEMGIPPYMISASIVLICSQRLLRRLCPECKEGYSPSASEKKLAEVSLGTNVLFYQPVGCQSCSHTGYRGRIGVYELLIPNDKFRRTIVSDNISTELLRSIAVDQCGMITLFRCAMEKVRNGVTSMVEAISKTKDYH